MAVGLVWRVFDEWHMPTIREAALGFSVHTGWAAMVAVSGSTTNPEIVDRRRIDLIGAKDDIARFVYHNAAQRRFPVAQKQVATYTKTVRKATLTALIAAVHELEKRGFKVVRACIIGGEAGEPLALDKILASHAAIHTAEGELYRGAIWTACETLGLGVRRVASRDLPATATATLKIKPPALNAHVAGAKRVVGSPWGADEKQAMLAAWLALATRSTQTPLAGKARKVKSR